MRSVPGCSGITRVLPWRWLCTGAGYVYHPLDDADYLLYSPGPDNRDDGGLIRYDHEQGYWVWRLHLPDNFDFEVYRGQRESVGWAGRRDSSFPGWADSDTRAAARG